MPTSDLLLIIVSSPSGAGKTTLTHRLLGTFANELTVSVTRTTRKPRATEVDGKDYHFIDRPTFEAMVERNQFAEWAEVHDNLYGTGVGELERARRENRRGVLFDVDYQGARQIKATFPDAIGVFILPPSEETLLQRLRDRKRESEEKIQKRFAQAQEEIRAARESGVYDEFLVNSDLEAAIEEALTLVRARRDREAG